MSDQMAPFLYGLRKLSSRENVCTHNNDRDRFHLQHSRTA